MIALYEYLNNKISKQERIEANNDTIKNIVLNEIMRLGLNADLNHIDTSEVTDMNLVFSPINYRSFTGEYREMKKKLSKFNGDVSKWDVSNVETMSSMFRGCEKFDCDLGDWDVSKVKDMSNMFSGCSSFRGIGLEKWHKDSLNWSNGMFDGCSNIKNREKKYDDPTTWEVGDILLCIYGYSMTLPYFFKITKINGKQFTCIRLKGKIVSGSRNGQWKEIATDEPYDGKEIKCRINKYGTIKIENKYATLWDGNPVFGDDMD